MELKVNQEWYYDDAMKSTVIILKMEEDTVHICVKNILSDDESYDIEHIPIQKSALANSLTKMKREFTSSPDFQEGYQTWKKDNGGVWNIPLQEVIDL